MCGVSGAGRSDRVLPHRALSMELYRSFCPPFFTMFYVKRFTPDKFTYRDALDSGELIANAFKDDVLNQYAAGEKNALRSRVDLRQSIHDPAQRLREYLKQARVYDCWCRSWAATVWSDVLADDFDVYGVYESGTHDRLVALSLWRYPQYMVGNLKQTLGKQGLWYKVWRAFKSLGLWLWQVSVRGFNEHPFLNDRLVQVLEPATAVHDANRLDKEGMAALQTYNGVETAAYPRESMVELCVLVTDPSYQRRGLGKMMLESALETIPVQQPEFGRHKVPGPQKLYLEASDAGVPLYTKMGFEQCSTQRIKVMDSEFGHTFMCLTRT